MKEENLTNFAFLCPVPFMSRERFCELTGFADGVVRGWVERGQIPTVLVGKHRAINLVLITRNCLEHLPISNDDN
jgi:hypothetical protein